jgi:hypothetical protein
MLLPFKIKYVPGNARTVSGLSSVKTKTWPLLRSPILNLLFGVYFYYTILKL